MSCILIISPEPWDGHFVSKHHYALELVRRGRRVVFYGPPELGPMRLEQASVEGPGRLEVLHAPRVAPGLRHMPGALRRRLEAQWIARVEQLVGVTIDVVWLFENSRFFDMSFAGDRLKIYHQVDLNQDFNPEYAARTADLSIAISGPIMQRIADYSQKCLRITHGCAIESLHSVANPEIETVFRRHSVNAVITGNMSIVYLDQQLLCELVGEHSAVGFHFVGRFQEGSGIHSRLARSRNAIFWGQQPFNVLPEFMKKADVLLVAYLAAQYLDQLANPHKIMEYISSGRCVLATRTLEYERRPELVITGCDADDYRAHFSAIVSRPSSYNTPNLVAQRQEFAADNTYPRQLDRIIAALGPRGALIA